MANIKYADLLSYLLIAPTDDDMVMFRKGDGTDGRAPLVQPKGYIDGLGLEWVSGTQIRISAGAAYVPGAKPTLEEIVGRLGQISLGANQQASGIPTPTNTRESRRRRREGAAGEAVF